MTTVASMIENHARQYLRRFGYRLRRHGKTYRIINLINKPVGPSRELTVDDLSSLLFWSNLWHPWHMAHQLAHIPEKCHVN